MKWQQGALFLTIPIAAYAFCAAWWKSTEPPQNPVLPAISNNLQLAEWRFLGDPRWCRRIDYTPAQATEEKRLFRLWVQNMAPCDVIQNLVLFYGFDYGTSEEVRWAIDPSIRVFAEKQVGGRLPHLTRSQARTLKAAAAKELGPWLWSDTVVAREIGIDSATIHEVHRKWNSLFDYYLEECQVYERINLEPTPYWILRLEGELPFQRVVRARKRMESELLARLGPKSRARWDAMVQG